MGYKKEIKDRELLSSFYVCLFVCCSQIAQYQQGHFELIVDWSQSNKYFIELKIAEFFFVWLGGKSCPTKYKRVGTNYVF